MTYLPVKNRKKDHAVQLSLSIENKQRYIHVEAMKRREKEKGCAHTREIDKTECEMERVD